MENLPDLQGLQAFVSVVDAGSLTRAAGELGIPRTTLARRLSLLEETLGVRLIKRTTRSLHVTDAGESFYHHATMTLDVARRAMTSVMTTDSAPLRGSLRVSLLPQMPSSFQRVIHEYVRTYPDVRLKLNYGTRYVDLLRDSYDVVIRAGQVFEDGLISRTIGRTEHVLMASTDYLTRHGSPERVEDLATRRCLMGFSRGESPQTHWPLREGGDVRVEGAFFSNQLTCVRELVMAGEGIALLPRLMMREELDRGEVEVVLPREIGAKVRVALLYSDRELLPPQVKRFIEVTLEWANAQDFNLTWRPQEGL